MSYRRSLALPFALFLFAGCASNSTPTPRDGGTMGSDGGPMDLDGGPMDLDGGPMATDGGPTGTDGGPECACRTLPATCSAPPANTVVFAPDESGAFQDQLYGVIACADSTLDIAIYRVTWDCIVDALEAKLAADSDIVMRIVVDDDECPNVGGTRMCPLDRIAANPRVTIVDDARSRYMHHKLVIADGARVWTSSANFSFTSFCSDHNDAIIVDQAEIVAGFAAEFERHMMGGFGPVPAAEPIMGGAWRLYFSPETPVDSPSRWFTDMVAAIETASTSIDIMTNAWTRTEVSDAIVAAHARGVTVRALVDSSYVDDAPAQALITAGIDTRAANVHDKVMVIDGRRVILGSANWSQNAWGNNESVLWVDDTSIASAMRAEMDRVRSGL